MLKLTRTIQIPTTVFSTDNFKIGEVYTILNSSTDSYVVSGLQEVEDRVLIFENGLQITSEQVEQGDYQLSPTETFLDRWVALYDVPGKEGGLGSSFFVAYDESDALGIAQDAARVNPALSGGLVISLIRLSDFMDNYGYMPHQSVQTLKYKKVGGRTLYVSE